MKIDVYAENSRESNIQAHYFGEESLPLARSFARRMSLFHMLVLETPDWVEYYRSGNLVETFWKNAEEINFLAEHSGYSPDEIRSDGQMLEKAYKKARRNLHPDKPAGNHELFLKLENIYKRLKAED